jgi:hypothetical protein
MHMTGPSGILSLPSEHLPGLIALAIIPIALWLTLFAIKGLAVARVAWAENLTGRLAGLSFGARAALVGLVVGAVVHVVLVPTHWGDAHVTALLFIVDAAGFLFAFPWCLGQRRFWELVAVAMLVGTAAVYALYLLAGWETADPVGILTTTIELACGLLLMASALSTDSHRRPSTDRWVALAAVPVALASLLGVSVIGGQLAAAAPGVIVPPARSIGTVTSPSPSASTSAMPGMQELVVHHLLAPLGHIVPCRCGGLARRHDCHGTGHGDGHSELRCSTDDGPTSSRHSPGGPDRGGCSAVQEPRRSQGGGLRTDHAIRTENCALHQSDDLSGGRCLGPSQGASARLREHRTWSGPLGGHVPDARRRSRQAATTGGMPHPVAYPQQPLLQ